MQFYGGSPGKCLSDPEQYILISSGLKSIGVISAQLVSTKAVAKKNTLEGYADEILSCLQ